MDIGHFFEQLIRRRKGPQRFAQQQQLKKILTEQAAKISQRASQFVKQLFLAENIREVKLFRWSYAIPNGTRSPICSKIMTEQLGTASFRCFECMESSSSCICGQCFVEGDHKGHNYIQYGAVNGCCDCGNAEAWNEKGFCKAHSCTNNANYEIPASTKSQYLDQVRFLLYIYFYLIVKVENKISLMEEYGNQLFSYLTSTTHENYQMKLLACQVLQSRFPQQYPFVPFREHNILEIIFRLPKEEVPAYSELIHWLFQIFPVQQFRKLVLREYFTKMRRREDQMTFDHPLTGLNFQFLSCVKLIINLIKSNQMQPLQLGMIKGVLKKQEVKVVPDMFKKLYEDLDYINNMKSAKQYHRIHLELTNAAQLAGYRDIAKVGGKHQLERQTLKQFNVDQMFLKILADMVANVRGEKRLIEKCLSELFHYIFNAGQNLASLAQERAFAMFVLAYFDGDLNQLFTQQARVRFIKALVINQSQFKYMLGSIIKASLQTVINLTRLQAPQRRSYEAHFLRVNSQRNLLQYLDILFHKILILMSQGVCRYDKVIFQWFCQKVARMEKEQLEVQQGVHRQNVNILVGELQIVLAVLNGVARVELDEVVVGSMIGLNYKEKAFELFSRVLVTFKHVSPKEFKNLCLELIFNDELFEEFVRNYTVAEKGKLKLKGIAKPLENIVYGHFFKKHSKQLPETQIAYLTGEQVDSRFKGLKIFHPDFISLAIDKSMQLISFLADEANPLTHQNLNSIAAQIFKIYLWQRKQQHKYFFCTLLNSSLRGLFSKMIIEQITLIEKKEEELAIDLQKIKIQQAEQFRLKREKIVNKRKSKEEVMKKNQEQMLSKFNKEVETIKASEDGGNLCIYCREDKGQALSLISYVGLTNLIQKSLLKQSVFHYFFSSCGHRIHPNCYQHVNVHQVRKYCLLCKQEANILIPQLAGKELTTDGMREAAAQFVANIISAIIDANEIENGKIGSFQNQIFEENLQLFLVSLAKEMVYNGLHGYTYFKKNLYPLYLQFFSILKLINKEVLSGAFDKIRTQWQKHSNHKLQLLERLVVLKLEQYLLGSKNESQAFVLGLTVEQIEQVNLLFSVIRGIQPQIQLSGLKQINLDTLFIKVPETLTELHQYMGKCKLCPNVTNNIYLCLVCGWSACIKCVKQIFKHVSEHHIDGSVIMGCSTGAVKYFQGNRIFQDSSIYENYLGLSFSDVDTYAEMSRAEKYRLNRQKELDLHGLMMHYEVHQKIQLNG